jgi:sugar phosphate isomerase/epimerase
VRLGISSFTYSWAIGVPGYPAPSTPLDAAGLLDKAKRLGVRLVQIADNLPLHTLSAAQRQALRAQAQSSGIGIEVGTRGIAPDHLATYLELAQYFASPILRVVIDTADHRPDANEVVEVLAHTMPAFERADVWLAIENHDRFRAADLAAIIRRVGSRRLGICLDTVNSFGALEGPEVVVSTLGPLTVNLHVKDFVVVRAGHKMGFVVEGRPAGQGQLDVPWLLQALHRMGRDVNAIVELWTPPEHDLAATIAREDHWASESVRYLRTLIAH